MEKIELGKTGIKVSRLGLGTVKFGRNEGVKYPEKFELPDEKSLAGFLAYAQELGINLIDTAPAYGLCEERLGRLLKGQRKNWVIISKAGEEFENGKSAYDFTPAHFEKSLERTLKRLQTDYLDVLLVHCDSKYDVILSEAKDLSLAPKRDPSTTRLQRSAQDDTPGELMEKLRDFKKRGLVKAIGASTKTIEGGLKAAELLDVVMCTPGQKVILDYAAKHKKGILLKKIFESGHDTNIQQAMDKAFAHPAVSAAIVGTIKREHLLQNVQAAQISLTSSSAASRGSA